MATATAFPLPGSGSGPAVVAAPAPGAGPGRWAGASCAALDEDGSYVIADRVRNGHDGDDRTVIARSPDGERLTTVGVLGEADFDAMGMERPALVRTPEGRWRLYVCCAEREGKRWWVDVLEAAEPEGLAGAEPRAVDDAEPVAAARPALRASVSRRSATRAAGRRRRAGSTTRP